MDPFVTLAIYNMWLCFNLCHLRVIICVYFGQPLCHCFVHNYTKSYLFLQMDPFVILVIAIMWLRFFVSLSCYNFCPLCSAFVPRFGKIIHNLIINFQIVPFVTLVFNITLINQCSYIYSIYPLPYCGGIIYDSVI